MFIEILKTILLGIVEGITEWLPVSSTGHMILLNEFLRLDVSDEFWEMFEVVIQLGAILAVVVLFFSRLNPFAPSKSVAEKRGTWSLWFKIIVAVVPSAVVGLLLDDWFNEHFYNYVVVAIALIVYGIAFILIEKVRKPVASVADSADKITYKEALLIGAFQVLAIIPGTSRSGSTILGAMLFGLSRTAAAEFSFFMAIPTMAGASLLKIVKFALSGVSVTMNEWIILAVGCLVAFLVSLAAIRYLMDYVKRHTFSAFGVYRIILGAVVIAYFLIAG
ncbi:MAG: undecaprenyl-diphosphate phosphatase [Clostridia bacterium]|nr:undecaprenyl-diphosphate phosphatase [Clostridia bacterium]